MTSRYEIHFGVSTDGSNQPLAPVLPDTMTDDLRAVLSATPDASADRLLAMVAGMRSTLSAVAAGQAGAKEAAAALAALAVP